MPFIPNESDAAYPGQAEVDSNDVEIILKGIRDDGVVTGCAVTAQGSPNMTLAVASGTVKIGGSNVSVSSGNVTVTAANGANNRYDLVVVDNAGVKSVVAGTAASIPVYPAIPANSVVLAAVFVPANDTAIESAQIIDKRVFVSTAAETQVGTHEGLPDPHPNYVLESLHASSSFDAGHHARGHTVTNASDHTFPGGTTTFLRADGTWSTPPGAGGTAWRSATLLVAASDATANEKANADYTCDGTADDVEIQAAIDAIAALSPARGTVMLTRGTYNTNATIKMKSNVGLQGAGRYVTYLNATSNITAGSSLVSLNDANVQFTYLGYLSLRGNGSTVDIEGIYYDNNGGTGFEHSDPAHVIEQVYIYSTRRSGLHLGANTRATYVSNVRAVNISSNGTRTVDGHAFWIDCPDSFFVNCDANTDRGHGFYITGGNNRFANCKAWFCGKTTADGGTTYTDYDGFYIGAPRNELVGCEAQDNSRHGFNFASGTNIATGLSADSNARETAQGGSNNGRNYVIASSNNYVEGYSLWRSGQPQTTYGIDINSNATDCVLTFVCRDMLTAAVTGTIVPSGTILNVTGSGNGTNVRKVQLGTNVSLVAAGALTQNGTKTVLDTDHTAAANPHPQYTFRRMKSGLYYTASGFSAGDSTGASTTQSSLRCAPLFVPTAVTLDRIGCTIGSTAASSSIRLGIYADDGTGYPGALVLDAGTIDSSTLTGYQEITINQALNQGLYWLAFVAQGGAPTVTNHGGRNIYLPQVAGTDSNISAFSQSSVTGALPANFTASVAVSGSFAKVVVRTV